jgi:hypothetical protein
VRTRLFLALAAATLAAALPAAQSDLDRLMSEVLARRDDNWKKLQQYTLIEENTFRLIGPMETPLFGSRREYHWFPREGFFVRSPVSADGVEIGDRERRRAEEEWLEQERRRERRRREARGDAAELPGAGDEPGDVPDVIRQTVEPQFVSAAYFMRFRFESGHYALVGREQVLGRDVLRIEYYPEQLFRMRRRPQDRREGPPLSPEEEARVARGMNKVSQVTLWVDPASRQILRYEFQNIDADFLPGRWLARLDALTASMQVGNPFPDVWLPASLNVRVELTLALGRVSASYDVAYRDYTLAETGGRVVVP